MRQVDETTERPVTRSFAAAGAVRRAAVYAPFAPPFVPEPPVPYLPPASTASSRPSTEMPHALLAKSNDALAKQSPSTKAKPKRTRRIVLAIITIAAIAIVVAVAMLGVPAWV